MEMDFDDLDDLVDRRADYYDHDDGGGDGVGDEDGDGDAERPDGPGEGPEDEKRIVPVKVRVKKPQPKLDPQRLKGPRGLSVLPTWFDNIKLRGKGHEAQDLNDIMNRLEQWTHRLFPRYTFDDAIDKLEKLGKKNEVKVMLKRIRLDLDNNDFVAQMEDDVIEAQPPPSKDDIFDRIANTIDIFPVTSTPSVNKTELTEEQRQRMMQNRMLAEERRQAKIKARKEQELLQNAPTTQTTTSTDSV